MIDQLINQISEAVLVVNRATSKILKVNNRLMTLSAFSKDELCGKVIENFFTGNNIYLHENCSDFHSTMKRYKKSDLPVIFSSTLIDAKNDLVLVKINDLPAVELGINEQSSTSLVDLIAELSLITQQPDINAAIKKALVTSRQLLNTQLISIYHARSGFPELKKIASIEAEKVFPEHISSDDPIIFSSSINWSPGRHVTSEIHRMGRLANLEFIASTPLGENGALFGLLVVGDKSKRLSEYELKLIELIGKSVSSAFQHFILVENLRQRVNAHENWNVIKDALLEESEEGIIIANLKNRITVMNSTAELIFGYSEHEVKNQQIEDILIGAEGISPAVEDAMRGIPVHDLGNTYLHRRNGQSFPAHVKVLPILKNDKVISIMMLVKDVSETEQIRIRSQQLEQRAVLGGFTAIFAHEVRNPINNISTGLQLMNAKLDPSDPNQNVIKRMQADCSRLAHLMESVLSFSRPLEPKIKPMRIENLLRMVLDRWRPRMERLNIHPALNYSKNIPPVGGDQKLLEQVFTNLISNAVNVMADTGGNLNVKILSNYEVANHPQIEITVSDTGSGIPEEILDRIFEPFVSRSSKGTGLGLAITKHIVTAHRGVIDVESMPGGTAFHVFLPVFERDKL